MLNNVMDIYGNIKLRKLRSVRLLVLFNFLLFIIFLVSITIIPVDRFIKISDTGEIFEENKNIIRNNFPEFSGTAKMMILTVHAPWIFKNNHQEKPNQKDFNYYTLDNFFVKLSVFMQKENSPETKCASIPDFKIEF